MQPGIDTQAIQEELERILASRIFLPAQRSQSFLRYIVEKSLAGTPPKEYEIAAEVFGRARDYDPAIDATVRVEAGRLRSRLREYYSSAGTADPILIEIPKGGYGAAFAARPSPPDLPATEQPRMAPQPATLGATGPALAAELDSAPKNLAANAGTASDEPRTGKRGRRWLWLIAGLATMAAAVATALIRLDHGSQPNHHPYRSLAVLPLENLSGDPKQEYFAEAITDALITELAHIPSLRVVSRTTVMQEKRSNKTLRQIAQELDVDAIVEGSVVRSGDRVRVTAQLIDARDDRHVWAQSYEEQMRDMLTLQDTIVREIAAQAQAALVPSNGRHASPAVDPQAYDAYLRGMYFLARREVQKSAACFQEALSLDPANAAAYAGLAEALVSEAVIEGHTDATTSANALAAAQHAIQLDPASGDAYAALGLLDINYKKDWPAAGHDLERAIQLSPGNSLAEMQYSIYLDAVGRPQDALTHMRRALRLDPLSFYMNRHLGSVLYLARDYAEALFYLHRALELAPDKTAFVEIWESRSYEESGQLKEAELSDLRSLGVGLPAAQLAPLRAAWERGGWKAYQAARIHLLAPRAHRPCDYYEVGESYLRLGNREQAFRWIGRGVEGHCFWADLMQVDPVLDDLRGDPRYARLLRLMNL